MTPSALGNFALRCSALRLVGRPPLQSSLASAATFKSSMHPDNLYPHAKYTDRFDPPKKPIESAKQATGFSGVIPPKELTITYRWGNQNLTSKMSSQLMLLVNTVSGRYKGLFIQPTV